MSHRSSTAAQALAATAAFTAFGAWAAALSPSAGNLVLSGTLADGGRFEIRALLKDGLFSGQGQFETAGETISGALHDRLSFYENGRCRFRVEQGRARAEISGKCDSTAMSGRFEAFSPGQGARGGEGRASVALQAGAAAAPQAGGGAATAAPAAPAAPAATDSLPGIKLQCAYMDRSYSFKWGESTQYRLAHSNMVSLTLADGVYRSGRTGKGSFERVGADRIRLSSGPWAGALGTLEPDRSGRPAVVFHIEDNRLPDGVHRIDPYTTRCTEPG